MHLAAKQRQHHGLQHRDTAVSATAQAAKHKTVPGVPQLLSALDQTLVKHSFALVSVMHHAVGSCFAAALGNCVQQQGLGVQLSCMPHAG